MRQGGFPLLYYGTAGIPDIIACIKGRFVAFEVKIPSNNLTELQKTTLRRITYAGGLAVKVTSVDEVRQYIMKVTEEETV